MKIVRNMKLLLGGLAWLALSTCVKAEATPNSITNIDEKDWAATQQAQADSIDTETIEETEYKIEETEYKAEVKKKRKPLLIRALDGVTSFLMDCDTSYVTRAPYQLTAEAEASYWHDYYYMKSSETSNSMTIKSEPSMVVGGFLYYSILGYGLSYNLNDIGKPEGEMNGTGIRQKLMVHTSKFFAEYYTFNSGKSAEISSISNMDIRGKNNRFKGLDSRCNGVSAMYIFNNKKYSWPAAFEGGAVQKKSCGSWSLGFQYNHQNISFNKNELPEHLIGTIDSTLMFSKVDYQDYSINIGYSYNWVLRRNVLFAVSVLPSIGYRRSNITEAASTHSILNNVSTDLNFRSSIMWNNIRFYSALMLELHTYSYRQNKLGLTNTYGTLRYVFGFHFWKKRL